MQQTSVVWTPVPELEDEMELRKKKEKAEVEKKKHYKASADFDSIPTKVKHFTNKLIDFDT